MAGDVFGVVGTVQAEAFRVDKVVAEGGFAVVYRAHHQMFRADIALKCLKIPGMLSKEQQVDFLEKFRAEAQLLFQLSSASSAVVRPLQVGTLTGVDAGFVPFIAMEWLEGESLARHVQNRRKQGKGPLTLEQAVTLLTPVARALELAHRFPTPSGVVSVVHRDLKPDNVFVATLHGQRVVKVLDFGIAKVKSAATQVAGMHSSIETGLTAFTPAYGAPEQWLPKRYGQTGTWTDVWGLALCTVEVLCGRPPFEGDAHALMGSALDDQHRPTPRNEGVRTSDAVDRVFQRALAVDPKARYHDVGRFWDELEAAVGLASSRRVEQPRIESLPPTAIGAAERMLSMPPAGFGIPPRIISLAPDADAPTRLDVAPRTGPREAYPSSRNLRTRQPLGAHDGYRGQTELDGVGIMPEEMPRSRGALRAAAPGGPGTWQQPETHPPRLGRRAIPGLRLIALAALIMAGDWLYHELTGRALVVGPARPFWLAAPLALAGVALVIYAFVAAAEEAEEK